MSNTNNTLKRKGLKIFIFTFGYILLNKDRYFANLLSAN